MTGFAAVHDELRAVARNLLAKPTRVDRKLLAETGWLGLEVPEALGGAGATFAETAVVLDELGRTAAPSAYLGAGVLGVGTLTALTPNADRDALLRDTASGALLPAVALVPDANTAAPNEPPFRLERGMLLHGSATFVPDAADADRLLVLARDHDGVPVVVDVPPSAPGLVRERQPVLDATRRLATVTATGVRLREDARWRFADDPDTAVRGLFARAATAVACDSLGMSEAMLAATVGYVGVREQFGRPVGSFQAVQHACADMLVRVSVARRLVTAAVAAGVTGEAPEVAAAMAKSYTCETAVAVAGKAMQLHGGIGYTWECGLHVHLKRATLNRALFGSPAAHRARLAERYRPTR
ncbi:acyl-CoA dehydrogenase family protein [Actinophytocola oryzae]|uniref:Alkylation response protein AidB-like acyl-CoA dehydrogenase n=1 Tax=Actinophytocola oryzae TaxID=502181 RepID=A0A4R7VKB3_9PSEU|nr:acyl-CoA dehydrogenase family protein [Actinophytocola oryzae]TDV49910.1 alkylation response protein AidB-like acyl-CoA dehydrogenase [Actinophytocola oryzae]